jgi:hypothetical protein
MLDYGLTIDNDGTKDAKCAFRSTDEIEIINFWSPIR